MDLRLINDTVAQTPASVLAYVTDADPDASLDFEVDSVTVYTTEVPPTGRLRVSIPLPPLAVGSHTVAVTDGIDTQSDTITVGKVPLDVIADDDTFRDPTTPTFDRPPGVILWTLYDEVEPRTFEFYRNPATWTSPHYPVFYNFDASTAPDGKILSWQAAGRAYSMEFSGYLDRQSDYTELLYWARLRRRFWLLDHRNRIWYLTFVQFDARARVVPNVLWAHDYTMKCLIFRRGSDDEVEI